MIDPISAFSAITAASGAISSAIKAGRDLSSLSGPVKKYAEAEAALNFGATRKKNSIFSKLTGAEQAGIDEFFRKQEVENLRKELRSIFNLYGKHGQWEALQAEIARQRQIQKEALEHQAKQREKFFAIITIVGLIGFGGGGLLLWVAWMKDWL
jgi:hypothetical protein